MGLLKYKVEESIEINSSLNDVWENIVSQEKKSIWSPWVILERGCEQSTEGKVGTVGYKESWKGEIIGEGTSEVTKIEKNKFIESKLNFIKPFKSESQVEFILEEKDGVTTITWKMLGSLPIFLFFLKKMMKFFISDDFKRGLNMLKTLCETGKLETKTEFVGEYDFKGRYYINLEGEGSLVKISKKMGKDFKELDEFLKSENITSNGYFTLYEKSDLMKNYFKYKSCVEVSEEQYRNFIVDDSFDYGFGYLEEGKYFQTTHYGSYEFLGNSWTGAFMYAKTKKLKINTKAPSIEYYEKGPLDTDDITKFETDVLIKLK